MAVAVHRGAVAGPRRPSLGGFDPFTPFAALHITGAIACSRRSASFRSGCASLLAGASVVRIRPAGHRDRAGLQPHPDSRAFALLIAIIALGVAAAPPAAGDQLRHRVRLHRAAAVEQFLLPAGIVLAERTLFLPSVGAMLIVGAASRDAADSS